MGVFIVSDLHISGSEDPLYGSLLELIRSRKPGDALVLAGGIFDLFVGSKRIFVERYSGFFEALTDAGRRGVESHYIEGNHDFLVRGAFRGIPGLSVHDECVTLERGKKRFYVAHGDTVGRSDLGYQALRILFRSLPMKGLVAALPGRLVDRIGRGSSRYSRGQKPLLPADLATDQRERLRRTYRSFAAEKLSSGCDFVVLGHCHDLDEMTFMIGDREGQYVNVGFPRVHGSYLAWMPGESRVQRQRLEEPRRA